MNYPGGEENIRSIVLLEDPSDIPAALSRAGKHGGDAIFISLSPSASYGLDRRKIPHRSMLSYGRGEDSYRTGLDNFKRLDNLFRVLETDMRELHGIPSLKPARYSMYSLKMLLDVLYTSIIVTHRILDEEHPDTICIPVKHSEDAVSRHGFSNEESVFARILSFDGWSVPVEFLGPETSILSGRKTTVGKISPGGYLRGWIRSFGPVMNIGLLAKHRKILSASGAFLGGLPGRSVGPVLIQGNGYNWDDALVELYRKGWRPVHRLDDEVAGSPPASASTQKIIHDIVAAHPQLQEFRRFLSIDTGPFLSERISTIVSDSFVESIASYRRTRDVIAKKGIRALLVSILSRPGDHAAVQAARDSGIPVISWQHGGSGYTFHPMMPNLECAHSDLHLVFGTPVAEKYREAMEWLGWEHRPPVVPVGSSTLDRIREMLPGGGPHGKGPVLYVTTAYLQNNFYISQPQQVIGWDEHLWQVQRGVIDLAGRFPGLEFIIKLHPSQSSREPLGSYIRDSGISNIRCISNEARLDDLLRRCSVLLFDLVSTGILQAMLTKKPVFLYSGLFRLDGEALELLRRRAMVSEDPDDFIGRFSGYLDGDLEARELADSLDFLGAYGLHTCD
ncbi:MAG: hypothetical protein ACM3X8_06645, partial [Methanomicrobiales archaeon]